MSPKSNEEHAARRLQSFDTERYDDGFDTEPPDGVLTELGAPPKHRAFSALLLNRLLANP